MVRAPSSRAHLQQPHFHYFDSKPVQYVPAINGLVARRAWENVDSPTAI